ncbi:MAG: hypothetical protein V1808_01875 [Candidatus Daviesbacteria bacterium]
MAVETTTPEIPEILRIEFSRKRIYLGYKPDKKKEEFFHSEISCDGLTPEELKEVAEWACLMFYKGIKDKRFDTEPEKDPERRPLLECVVNTLEMLGSKITNSEFKIDKHVVNLDKDDESAKH